MERNTLINEKVIVYKFLAKCFLEIPTEDVLQEVYDAGILANFPIWSNNEFTIKGQKRFKEVHNFLNNCNIQDLQRDIQFEYTRLFIGPKIAAPPWESVYLSKDGLTFGAKTLEVRNFYRRHNLQIEKFNREPDDHIGYELEFIAHLYNKTKENDRYYTEIHLFLKEHLMLWIDAFSEQILENTFNTFFIGLINLTKGLVKGDFEILNTSKNNIS